MTTRPLDLRDGKVVDSIRVGTVGLPYFAECLFCHVEYHARTYGEAKGWADSHYWTKHKVNEDKGQEGKVIDGNTDDKLRPLDDIERIREATGVGKEELQGREGEKFGDHEVAGGGDVVGEGGAIGSGQSEQGGGE